jgi:hypothetical protein
MKKIKEQSSVSGIDHLTFTAIGLACHALCLIDSVGILNLLKDDGEFLNTQCENYANPHLIKGALVTLVGANVLALTHGAYSLTDLGKNLANNIGTITLPFVGYRKLLAKQFALLKNPSNWKDTEIDYSAVALSSIEFGLKDLDPIVMDVFRHLKPKGTICDLGCGTGEKLVKICKFLKINGLGIEKNHKVIRESKRFIEHCSNVEILQGDVFNLKGVWEDVEIAMISFVYHDINSSENCVKFLNSLHDHFPRLSWLIIIDIVSLSEELPSIMPGFDYVHGLQGITPRSYEETMETFARANFKVFKEIAVANMPNTFVWITKKNN